MQWTITQFNNQHPSFPNQAVILKNKTSGWEIKLQHYSRYTPPIARSFIGELKAKSYCVTIEVNPDTKVSRALLKAFWPKMPKPYYPGGYFNCTRPELSRLGYTLYCCNEQGPDTNIEYFRRVFSEHLIPIEDFVSSLTQAPIEKANLALLFKKIRKCLHLTRRETLVCSPPSLKECCTHHIGLLFHMRNTKERAAQVASLEIPEMLKADILRVAQNAP